jgi:hypothetical protein
MKQQFVTKDNPLGKGEFLIGSLSRAKGLHRNLVKFAIRGDGETFISPGLLSPRAGISPFVDQVALAIEGGPILAPLSWAKANYPEHAEMLHHLEMCIRESVSNVFIFPDGNARQVAAKEGQANGTE